VIGLVETVERGPVYAEQRRLPVRGVEPVEIDQQAHHAIIEAMADRLQARVHHLAKVERGGSKPAVTLRLWSFDRAWLLRGLRESGQRTAPRCRGAQAAALPAMLVPITATRIPPPVG
jgi:hypothetical protein